MADRPVTLAVIIGAHAVTGEVRLKLFCDSIDSVKAHKVFTNGTLTLKSLRPNKGGAIARFAEIADRNAAEAARGTELTVPRASLPELGEGEYYHIDLIGLSCVTEDGAPLGECIAVENFGASDVLEIRRDTGKSFMVPMIPAAVPAWDDSRIVIAAAFAE